MTDILDDQPDDITVTIEDLVGPGKKYADANALAKAYAHLEEHAETVKQENAAYRADLRARTSLEEITERIARQAQQETPPVDRTDNAAPPATPDAEDISEKVLKILEEERRKANREGNLEKSRSGLRDRFGADYNLYLQKAAKSLGVSEKFLGDLAASSPDGLLKMVDSLNLREDDLGAPPPNTLDTSKAFGQQVRKNAAYYNKLRKEDRAKYFSAAVQKEMHDEAFRQGAKFYES